MGSSTGRIAEVLDASSALSAVCSIAMLSLFKGVRLV